MSSYYSFMSLNSDGNAAADTGTVGFPELDLLQKYNPLPQSPFSLSDLSETAASSATKCYTMWNCRKMNSKKTCKRRVSAKIAFRTKSDLEILDDGYRWRKYGKKMVKTNPNPRNYYHCSSEGCGVKKRVERARDDWCYIITTYEGMHNHHAPASSAPYYC